MFNKTTSKSDSISVGAGAGVYERMPVEIGTEHGVGSRSNGDDVLAVRDR